MRYPHIATTLKINSAVSAVAGLALLAAPAAVGGLLGAVPVWLCQAVGVGLLIFAADVLWVALRLPHSQRFVAWICAADIAWVAATPLVMQVFASELSVWGHLILVDAALLVAAFAFLEWRSVREGVHAETRLG